MYKATIMEITLKLEGTKSLTYQLVDSRCENHVHCRARLTLGFEDIVADSSTYNNLRSSSSFPLEQNNMPAAESVHRWVLLILEWKIRKDRRSIHHKIEDDMRYFELLLIRPDRYSVGVTTKSRDVLFDPPECKLLME